MTIFVDMMATMMLMMVTMMLMTTMMMMAMAMMLMAMTTMILMAMAKTMKPNVIRFAEAAAERHIPKCKDIKSNKKR